MRLHLELLVIGETVLISTWPFDSFPHGMWFWFASNYTHLFLFERTIAIKEEAWRTYQCMYDILETKDMEL